MNNVALGQYMPLDSVVHKMDPRSKIMIMLFLMVAIFIPAGVLGYAIIGAFILFSLYLSKLNIQYALRTMKPMLWMMAFLLVINLLVIKTGTPLFSIKGFTIYSDAVNQTLYIVVRLMLMVIITTVLTATTKPLDLTLGIEKLLKPFEKVGVPAHIIAMMISIALRFIPTLIEETSSKVGIMDLRASVIGQALNIYTRNKLVLDADGSSMKPHMASRIIEQEIDTLISAYYEETSKAVSEEETDHGRES